MLFCFELATVLNNLLHLFYSATKCYIARISSLVALKYYALNTVIVWQYLAVCLKSVRLCKNKREDLLNLREKKQ